MENEGTTSAIKGIGRSIGLDVWRRLANGVDWLSRQPLLMLVDVRMACLLFFAGLRDACRWPTAWKALKLANPTHLRWLVFFNGCLLGVAYLVYRLIDFCLASSTSVLSAAAVAALRTFFSAVMVLLLVVAYLVAFLVNIWFIPKITGAAQRTVRVVVDADDRNASASAASTAKPSNIPQRAWLAEFIGDIGARFDTAITAALVNVTMVIISVLTMFVPVFGTAISFAQTAMIYGHVLFENRLAVQQLGPFVRIGFVDRHWLYFLGFGTPLTLATFFLPFFPSAGLYSLLLPAFAAMSWHAQPLRAPLGKTRIPERISYASEAHAFVVWLKSHYRPQPAPQPAAPSSPSPDPAVRRSTLQLPLPQPGRPDAVRIRTLPPTPIVDMTTAVGSLNSLPPVTPSLKQAE